MKFPSRQKPVTGLPGTSGVIRIDRRTSALVRRLKPGDIAVIDHADLDRVAAETLVDARPAAIVNVATSITGRYPNLGPLLICQSGIPLVDGVGAGVLDLVHDGDPVAVEGDALIAGGVVVATGTVQSVESLGAAIDEARKNMGAELERFASNTVEYVRDEISLLTGELALPPVDVDFAGRQALIVVRGIDYKEDLSLLRRSGYLRDLRPVLIGVDGGADALLEIDERQYTSGEIPAEKKPLDHGFCRLPERMLEDYRRHREKSELGQVLKIARRLQENVDRVIVLGIGGVRILRALGYHHLVRYHMNEGHSALLAVELMRRFELFNRRRPHEPSYNLPGVRARKDAGRAGEAAPAACSCDAPH